MSSMTVGADGFAIPRGQNPSTESSPSPPPPVTLSPGHHGKRKRDAVDLKLSNDVEDGDTPAVSVPPSKKQKTSDDTALEIYCAPNWGREPPSMNSGYELEVIKNGVALERTALSAKPFFIFGRDSQSVDVETMHPSCSRVHAVLQWHSSQHTWLVFDFGSTHGTKLNHKRLRAHKYYKVDVAHILQFGSSQRMYILNGPPPSQPEPEPQPQPKDDDVTHQRSKHSNSMQHMMQQLAQRSKTEQQQPQKNSAHKTRASTSCNVWGIDTTDDCDNSQGPTSSFDEQAAKQNEFTKALHAQLQSKRAQCQSLENELKRRQSMQRSDKPLNQNECVKIEKMRAKIERLEDDIETLHTKIMQRLATGAIESEDGDENGEQAMFEDDGFEFDDGDDFYDRIKNVRRKQATNKTRDSSSSSSSSSTVHHRHALNRNARMASEQKASHMRDYDSFKDELDNLELQIFEAEQTLRDISFRRKQQQKDEQHSAVAIAKTTDLDAAKQSDVEVSIETDRSVDDFVQSQSLKTNDGKYSALKQELQHLHEQRQHVLKMVNMLRPTYFKVMQKEPDRVRTSKSTSTDMMVDKLETSRKKTLQSKTVVTSKEPKVSKPGSLADIAEKMKTEELKKKATKEAVEKETARLQREREVMIAKQKQNELARQHAVQDLQQQKQDNQHKEEAFKMRDKATKHQFGLIVHSKKKTDAADSEEVVAAAQQQKTNALEAEFAEILANTGQSDPDDHGDNIGAMDEIQFEDIEQDMQFLEEANANWVPPKNQTGDGKTWLNDKFNY